MGGIKYMLGVLILAVCVRESLSQIAVQNFTSYAKTCSDCNSTTSADCNPKAGGYVLCSCKSGFLGDGLNCTKYVFCDSYSCCPQGYNWNSVKKQCVDINECSSESTNECLGSAKCNNKNGIYLCAEAKNPSCPATTCDTGYDCHKTVLANGAVSLSCIDPCEKNTAIDGSNRLFTIDSTKRFSTDRYLFGWYRYNNGLGLKVGCVGPLKCGSLTPLSLSSQPTPNGTIQSVTLINNGLTSCTTGQSILTKACPGGYYVYKFNGLLNFDVYCTELPPIPTAAPNTTVTTVTTPMSTSTSTTVTIPTTQPTSTTTPTTEPTSTTTSTTPPTSPTTPTTEKTSTTTPATEPTSTTTPTTPPTSPTTPTTEKTSTTTPATEPTSSTTPTTPLTSPTTPATEPTSTTTPATEPTSTTTPATEPTSTITPATEPTSTTTPTTEPTSSTTPTKPPTSPTTPTTETTSTTTPATEPTNTTTPTTEPTNTTTLTTPPTSGTTEQLTNSTTIITTHPPTSSTTTTPTSISTITPSTGITTIATSESTTACHNTTSPSPVIPTTHFYTEENITVTTVKSKSVLSVRLLSQVINNKEVKSLEINETTIVNIEMKTISTSKVYTKITNSISPTSFLIIVGDSEPKSFSNKTDTSITTSETTVPNTVPFSPDSYCSKPAATNTITETSAIAGNTCSKITSASATTTITTTEEVIVLGPDGFSKSCSYF